MSKKWLALFFALFVIFSFNVSAGTENNPYLDERFVINALRQIQNAQMTYQSTAGAGNFGLFYNLYAANLIDSALSSGGKYGYNFIVNTSSATGNVSSNYSVTAVPRRYGKTGRRSFYINENCEIRGADKNGSTATVIDPIIETCSPSMRVENERLTIQALRTIHSAQMNYQSTIGNGNFGTMSQLLSAGLINQSLGLNFYRGYFRNITITALTAVNPPLFTIQTRPETYGRTGIRSFFIDQTGVIRGADRNGLNATQNDPPIEDEQIRQGNFQGFSKTYNLSAQSDFELLRISN